MYVVIFKAKAAELDSEYFQMAEALRLVAFEQFNCQGFESRSQDGYEIATSYWQSMEDIWRFKSHFEHQKAQENGRKKWYESYQVEICEIIESYGSI